jgi:hypothetical protein
MIIFIILIIIKIYTCTNGTPRDSITNNELTQAFTMYVIHERLLKMALPYYEISSEKIPSSRLMSVNIWPISFNTAVNHDRCRPDEMLGCTGNPSRRRVTAWDHRGSAFREEAGHIFPTP